MMGIRILTVTGVLVISGLVRADLRLEVRAGGHDRENCPVALALPEVLKEARLFSLVRESDGASIPVQRLGSRQAPRIMWMIHDRLKAGDKRTYRLSATDQRPRNNAVTSQDDGQRLTLSVHGAPVLKFNHKPVAAPEGIDPVYSRSGYIHPVFTPNGNVVTGDFEKDHPHQHGVFFAWVNATFREQPVDFWNQAKRVGGIEFNGYQNSSRGGPVFAQFTAKLSHFALIDGNSAPAIEETCLVRVFNSQKPFLVEIISRQTAATDDPIHVNEYHYGGFAVRGPSEWLISEQATTGEHDDPAAAGAFLTSEGRTRTDGNHTRARWVEMHGPRGSQHAGIIVLSAPQNFRSPQTVRLHPTKPYFCFAPMVLGAFKIEPQPTYASRYRLVVHDGEHDPDLAERMWQDLAHPPKVKVIAN